MIDSLKLLLIRKYFEGVHFSIPRSLELAFREDCLVIDLTRREDRNSDVSDTVRSGSRGMQTLAKSCWLRVTQK